MTKGAGSAGSEKEDVMRATVLIVSVMLGFLAWGVARDIPLPEGASGLELAWAPDGSGIVVLYQGADGGTVAWLKVGSGETCWQVAGYWLPPRSYPLPSPPAGIKWQ